MSKPLRAAPTPVQEPIVCVLVTGQVRVVQPDDPAWEIAYAYREEKAARELAEGDLRGKRALIRNLRDEQEAKRRSYARRDVLERVFDVWREVTGHSNAKLGPKRFDQMRARLEEGYEELHLLMAVHGLGANAYEGHDDISVCMRDESQLEKYANKCPGNVRRQLRAEDETRKGDQMKLA